MATCRMCSRSGFFLDVNKYSICSTCGNAMVIEVQSRWRVISESMKLVETGKTLETRLSRCDLIIEYTQALLKYEKLGIPITKPPPSEIIKFYADNRPKFIKDGLLDESRAALEKSKLATTVNSKVSALSKAVLRIVDFKKQYPDDKDLQTMDEGLRKAIQEIQLTAFLDDAKKAEFKNNRKKALDKYYEALYFLQHDDIDDALQSESINIIETKIKELS